MISRSRSTAGATLIALLLSGSVPAIAGASVFGKKKPQSDTMPGRKLTAAQNALIDKAIVREKEVIKVVKERAPLVETYIQNMKPDPVLLEVPESDEHHLARVDFSKVINDDLYKPAKGPYEGKKGKLAFLDSLKAITGISSSLRLTFHESGFVQMILMDSTSFDREHYTFTFIRNDFLGNIPTAVFDVQPISGKREYGRFFGRIWVETHEGNVVRFNGDFAGSIETMKEFYHFDSWRTNVQPHLWLPTSFYVEESDPRSPENTLRFKAINYVWGYVLKVPDTNAENTSMDVVNAQDVSQDSPDVSPLGAQREWQQQAEDNVIERLFQAGLLDAPSEFDKTLEALANNILAFNNIAVSRPIRVRTLLTEPLESLAVGNTIIVSKSLIDTTSVLTADGNQQLKDLYAILAFQVAHIILDHRLDTKYAFSDRLLFPSTSVFEQIPMHHTDVDNTAAAKKAIELLSVKDLADAPQYFGLYLQQLQVRLKGLPALNTPMIGDGLTKSDKDPTFWMQALVSKGIKLDMKDLKQQAAMPLANYLRFDPWTDQLIKMSYAGEPIINERDKMPFEVEPVYLKLTYYTPPAAPAAPAPAAPAAAAPAADGATPPTPPAPAAADTTAAPAAADATTQQAAPTAAGPQ
ncbi:MAG TPA: hypothetical protein VGU23_01075 [Acidobacteriaceae bacterium]|nr:hypothetical protein [Acidobacteriaceae bacterium]